MTGLETFRDLHIFWYPRIKCNANSAPLSPSHTSRCKLTYLRKPTELQARTTRSPLQGQQGKPRDKSS